MPTARINGAEIFYDVHGEGSPLLLSHGGFGNTSHFDSNVPGLAQRHRVIVYDRRGCGRSSQDVEGVLSAPTLVEDLYQLIRHLGIDRAYVGGVSYGAMLTLELALAHPEVVAAAILVSGTARGYTGSGRPNDRYIPFPDRVSDLRRVTCPTLIIQGDQDQVFPPSMAEELHKGIQGSQLVIFSGAGHGPHRDQPENFNNQVLAFLAEVEARPRVQGA